LSGMMAVDVVGQVTLMGHSAGAQLSAMALLQRVATPQQASNETRKVNGTMSDPRMPVQFVGEDVWATPVPSLAFFCVRIVVWTCERDFACMSVCCGGNRWPIDGFS
jgi:hypothetical protein